jgi:hypothetical protein
MNTQEIETHLNEDIIAPNTSVEEITAAIAVMLQDMSHKDALRVYGVACGINAMAWATFDYRDDDKIERVSKLNALLDALAPLLEARGFVPTVDTM